jgi:AcrR family transcriptional regulator
VAPDVKSSWRQEQAAATRRRIAEAAQQLFASEGYAVTSIDRIAQESGVAVRTVYSAFGSKREILSEICEAWLSRAQARERAEMVLAEPEPRRRLRRAVEWLADLYAAGFDVVQILESASDEGPETQVLLRAKLAGRDRVMNEFIRSLRPELAVPLPEAQSMYRALATPGLYRELVIRTGWDRERFCSFVEDILGRSILR